jgi:hypothetical protein
VHVFRGVGFKPLWIPHPTAVSRVSGGTLWPQTMFPDGVLKEPFFAAPPAPSATEVTRTAAEATARTARELRRVRGFMVSS